MGKVTETDDYGKTIIYDDTWPEDFHVTVVSDGYQAVAYNESLGDFSDIDSAMADINFYISANRLEG